jgi:hypothetical protein
VNFLHIGSVLGIAYFFQNGHNATPFLDKAMGYAPLLQ